MLITSFQESTSSSEHLFRDRPVSVSKCTVNILFNTRWYPPVRHIREISWTLLSFYNGTLDCVRFNALILVYEATEMVSRLRGDLTRVPVHPGENRTTRPLQNKIPLSPYHIKLPDIRMHQAWEDYP
jgi:hypothetical protein